MAPIAECRRWRLIRSTDSAELDSPRQFGSTPNTFLNSSMNATSVLVTGRASAVRKAYAAFKARQPPSDWARVMLDWCGMTVAACDACHDRIHDAQSAGSFTP